MTFRKPTHIFRKATHLPEGLGCQIGQRDLPEDESYLPEGDSSSGGTCGTSCLGFARLSNVSFADLEHVEQTRVCLANGELV